MEFLIYGKRFFLLCALILFVSPTQASLLDGSSTLLRLQPYKQESTVNYGSGATSSVTLLNLNSNINTWYLLAIADSRNRVKTHNILTVSEKLKLKLNPDAPELLISRDSNTYSCNIDREITWVFNSRNKRRSTYVPICNNLLFITVKQDGFRTMKERGAEVLRWLAGDAGEQVINQVKEHFFQDKYLVEEKTEELAALSEAALNNSPLPRALIRDRYLNASISSYHLGLRLKNTEKKLLAGEWYPLQNFPDVYTSLITPGMVSKEIQASHKDRVNYLDSVERTATTFLMSFSLNRYTMGWGHGTDHPGVGWSRRARNIKRDNPYGPDGFNKIHPLIPLGHVPPVHLARTIGTFSGGFQNRHAAFKYGKMSTYNKAHHYGFMENGVMLTSPSVDLATVIIFKDGRVVLKRWTEEDNKLLPEIRHLRQNGVPLIHRDENGKGIPGKLVKHWTRGNWSGSANKELRAPRGGACLIERPRENYLVYAFFSSVTPSGMARVFQSYGCSFAIHLDLNSPGQAYGSLFRTVDDGSSIDIELLMNDMHAYMGGNRASPRYFVKPDYKDFFYIMRRE